MRDTDTVSYDVPFTTRTPIIQVPQRIATILDRNGAILYTRAEPLSTPLCSTRTIIHVARRVWLPILERSDQEFYTTGGAEAGLTRRVGLKPRTTSAVEPL
jgi:hypothetical protein